MVSIKNMYVDLQTAILYTQGSLRMFFLQIKASKKEQWETFPKQVQ